MQFTPKTEKEIAMEGLLDEGTYPFEVVEAKDEVSKKGNEMIAIKLKVFGPNGEEHFLRDWIMEKVSYKLRHFCEVTGLLPKYEKGSLDALECVGVSGYCVVAIKDNKDFGPQNQIKDYVLTPESSEKAKSLTEGDDDIPF